MNLFQDVYPLNYNNSFFCGDDLHLSVGKKKVELSHFPKKVWDFSTKNAYHLHGHCHGGLVGSNPSDATGFKILDVGVENAIKFNGKAYFSWAEVESILEKRKIQEDYH